MLATKREKIFGPGRGRPLDRNARARLMHLARCLMRPTEPGKHYGPITAKALGVFKALLWGFHNAKDGRCFPSYERIAEVAHCARSTVYEAITALEAAGLMTWDNRIKRVREPCPDLLGPNGWRWRVKRTSNAYRFPSKSENKTGTEIQDLDSSLRTAKKEFCEDPDGGLAKIWAGIQRKAADTAAAETKKRHPMG